MSADLFFVASDKRPDWVEYPNSFKRLVYQGLIHLTPWHIMDAQQAVVHARELAERYPTRDIFPFAYRQDIDDIACWEKDSGETVLVIHDFASAGWENGEEFSDVWAWFRSAVEETIVWD
jgi:hypothetical protein